MQAKYINTEESKGIFITDINAPRWVKLPRRLRDLAFEMDLEIKLFSEKSLLRERVHFTVYGVKSRLEKFKEILEEVMNDWNDTKND